MSTYFFLLSEKNTGIAFVAVIFHKKKGKNKLTLSRKTLSIRKHGFRFDMPHTTWDPQLLEICYADYTNSVQDEPRSWARRQPLDFLLNGGICESTERDDGTVPSKTEAEAGGVRCRRKDPPICNSKRATVARA